MTIRERWSPMFWLVVLVLGVWAAYFIPAHLGMDADAWWRTPYTITAIVALFLIFCLLINAGNRKNKILKRSGQ